MGGAHKILHILHGKMHPCVIYTSGPDFLTDAQNITSLEIVHHEKGDAAAVVRFLCRLIMHIAYNSPYVYNKCFMHCTFSHYDSLALPGGMMTSDDDDDDEVYLSTLRGLRHRRRVMRYARAPRSRVATIYR